MFTDRLSGGTLRSAVSLLLVCLLLTGAVAAAGGGETPSKEPEEEAQTDPLDEYGDRLETAIEGGLAYLAKNQREDGSWPGKRPGNSGVAGLAVMAFLANGHTPGAGPYSDVVRKGIEYVLNQDRNGMLAGPRRQRGGMYSHCISTLMISEVSGMVGPELQGRIDERLPEALKIILEAQNIQKRDRFKGGWRYNRNSKDSDISMSGWAFMALRSARNKGMAVPRKAVEKGLGFIEKCRHASGGFCYQPGRGPGIARTGVALLCLELGGKHDSELSRGAAEWILDHRERAVRGHDWPAYGLYYCSQGLYQLGGEYWEKFAAYIYQKIPERQRDDGSWPGTRGGGAIYATSMAVLALSVQNCQLPVYQR